MNTLNNAGNQYAVTALYARLSVDDELDGVSNSITNQNDILNKYAEEQGFTYTRFYYDDGVSGTTFEREGFRQMIADIEKGEVKTVVVKDLSRFGRDHLKVGYYMEVFFPNYDVRFIAIYDNVDSENGDNEFAPFKNIFNEWYARDCSKKIRQVLQNKGRSGDILCPFAPYGYLKDPNDKKHWFVDEEAAAVVKEIYDLFLNGLGICKIASILEDRGVLSPAAYLSSKGFPTNQTTQCKNYKWSGETVKLILTRQEYTGDVVNFKTTTRNYKSHQKIKRPIEERAIFKDVNVPIIPRNVWEEVQVLYAKKKRVPTKRDPDIFQSYVFCSDCGGKMYIRFKKGSTIGYYSCSGYAKHTTNCTTHFIKQEDIKDLVLKSIREVVSRANLDKAEFAKELSEKADSKFDKEYKQTTKEIGKMKSRSDSLDKIIKQLFEDRVLGKISDERYFAMAEGYEKEQAEIRNKLDEYQAKKDERDNSKKGVEYFLNLVSSYNEIEELTPKVLSEFIDKILVHQAVKDENGTSQTVEIYYKGVGALN